MGCPEGSKDSSEILILLVDFFEIGHKKRRFRVFPESPLLIYRPVWTDLTTIEAMSNH